MVTAEQPTTEPAEQPTTEPAEQPTTEPAEQPTTERPLPRLPALLVAGLPPAMLGLALYARTLLPDVGFWDTAEFQAIGPVLGIAHPTGYPAYTLLAWLASVVLQPLGEPALRANLLSALLVAGAAGLVAVTVTLLTRRVLAGVAAGVTLAVAGGAWSVALRADPHALHLFLVALLLFLLVGWRARLDQPAIADRWLLAAAIAYGVSLGNHALTLLLAPGIALFVFGSAPSLLRRPRFVAGCALALALTTIALYAYLPLRSAMNPPLDYANPQTLEGFRHLVLGEQFRGTFRALPAPAEALGLVVASAWHNVGLMALLAPLGALVAALRRPALAAMLAVSFAVTWLFSLAYINADIERYHLGPLVVVVVLGGVGAGTVIDALHRLARSRAAQPAPAWRALVAALATIAFIGPALAGVPSTLARVDQSDNLLARRWLDSVLPRLEPQAVLISWWSYSTTLWYAQFVEGQRPDVSVVDDRTIVDQQLGDVDAVIDRYLGQRPVYLIRTDNDLPLFEQRYHLRPLGALGLSGGRVQLVEGRRDEGSLQSVP